MRAIPKIRLPNPALVHMGGFQMLLAGDILRVKFRNSFGKPQPVVPGAATKLEIPPGDKCHTFLKRHRITVQVQVQVQGSWFPMFDRNPHMFANIYHAKQVILLSYPDEPHHLGQKENQKDFQIRMKQYFDHYLKGAPMAKWMAEGLPQTRKGAGIE